MQMKVWPSEVQTSMKKGPYLQQLTTPSIYATFGWVLKTPLTNGELWFEYSLPRETELEKQSLQGGARVTAFAVYIWVEQLIG